jgi:predicted transcriptional regulator
MVFEGVAVTLLILLAFLVLAMVMGGTPANEASGISDNSYSYVGPDNVLYVLSPDHIQAFDARGTQAWNFTVPKGWKVAENSMPMHISRDGSTSLSRERPSAASDNGVLYVCLKPAYGPSLSNVVNVTLMAISDEGRALWTLPIDSYVIWHPYAAPDNNTDWASGDVEINVLEGKIYVFHNFNETVVAPNGTVLWSVAGVSDPAAVDEDGYVYCVKNRMPDDSSYVVHNSPAIGFPLPSSAIDAYYPNGTLYWENYTGDWINRQSTDNYYNARPSGSYALPVYHDGLLYVPTGNGITVFYRNGTVKWSRMFTEDELKLDYPADLYQKPDWFVDQVIPAELSLYAPMPFDQRGNVYLVYKNDYMVVGYRRMLLITISPDGNATSWQQMDPYAAFYLYVKDGIGYNYSTQAPAGGISNVTDLQGKTLHAYDIKSGKELWNYRFAAKEPNVAVVDSTNVQDLLGGYPARDAIEHAGDTYEGVRPAINSGDSLDIKFANDTIYANFQSYNYEYPIILGKSKLAYTGGIHALADNGSLLWYKPVRAQDYSMQVTPNGTVFYRTPDGRVGVTGAGIAGGFTLTALLYLFLRFVCVGAVARAKARLNKNDNRNRVLDFIINNPGSTLYEVARGTGMNLGTARYHLFILGLNHKIVASNIDGKYVRYFTNSGTYSREQQLVLSLLKRDSMGKILGLLSRRPGISNVEIAGEVGMPESITSRYLKELSEKGVVRNLSSGRERAYSIDEAYYGHVADAVRRLQGH